MSATEVKCRFLPGAGCLRLRELSGHDEQMVRDSHTATAVDLLNRLVIAIPKSGGRSWSAAALTASDRDRLLARVYARNFGPKVQSTARCAHCGDLFDLEFDIEELSRVLDAPAPASTEPLEDGTFRLKSGVRFRLPSGEDEISVADGTAQDAERALLERCLLDWPKDRPEDELAAVEEAMEEIAPVLDLNLDAKCPECGRKQLVHFNVQFYLLRSIEQGWKQAAREVHLLAMAYGWSLQDILALPRSQRRMFVELVETERSVRQRSRA